MTGAPQTPTDGERMSLTVHADDNVVTLLDTKVGCNQISGGITISQGIPFGHKAALCDIAAGAPVIKYGIVIGQAKCDIASGEHVHVHNIE